jgi:hypothetical protein
MRSLKNIKLRKGGGNRSKIRNTTLPDSIVTYVLLGVLLFLVYQMTQMNQTEPDTIVKEKIIYKTIEKEEEDEPYREDIYKPDLKRARRSPPFNYPTRGPPEEYDMVGFLQDPDDTNKLQQLYGRRTYPNSNNWNYFVKSDQYHQIPIPVSVDGQNCTDERGCKELNNQESLNLFNKDHTATIYKPEPYYYNPYRV